MSDRAERVRAVPGEIEMVPLRTSDPTLSPLSLNPAIRLTVPDDELTVEPVWRTTLSPARRVTLAAGPVAETVTPALTVRLSPVPPVSVAVASRPPLLVVLTANVSGPPVVARVVVPPGAAFVAAPIPSRSATVNPPMLRMFTTPVDAFLKSRLVTWVENGTAPVPIPVPARTARFVTLTTSAAAELLTAPAVSSDSP